MNEHEPSQNEDAASFDAQAAISAEVSASQTNPTDTARIVDSDLAHTLAIKEDYKREMEQQGYTFATNDFNEGGKSLTALAAAHGVDNVKPGRAFFPDSSGGGEISESMHSVWVKKEQPSDKAA